MIYSFATEKERDAAAARGTPTATDGTASQAPQGDVGQGSGTPKGSVIPEIHYPKSQEMVSAIPRTGVHGEVLSESRLQRAADRHAHQRQAAVLRGELYSEEHKRKFTTERAGFQVVKDPKDRSKLALAINGQLIGEWFREQFSRLFSSIMRTVEPLRRSKGMGL